MMTIVYISEQMIEKKRLSFPLKWGGGCCWQCTVQMTPVAGFGKNWISKAKPSYRQA